ncbi:serine/threonine-protein kinase pim-2-like [Labrus bergylta]|uniref:serine/threonine-protein kinase pim-2-like n=1 Tax=Labrus bergylta TaxID=56723 RepID=UPI0033140758
MGRTTSKKCKTLHPPARRMCNSQVLSFKEGTSSITESRDLPVSTRREKNNSSTDRDSPKQRTRASQSDSAGTGGKKRKSSEDQEDIRKRQRTSDPDPSKYSPKVTGTKRKAPEEDDGLRKRQRQEDTSSSKEAAKSNKATTVETSRLQFEEKYQQLHSLGEGGHGSVYAGLRRADHFPVAIKLIPRDNVICKGVTVKSRMLPLEVAVMMKLAKGAAREEGKSASISLLDFYDLDQELILILERPVPAVDLLKYIEVRGGSLQEEEGREIVKQLVEAARELQSKNIFHRDIKVENILIETGAQVPRVRLIDFGLSCFTKKRSSYKVFYGTPDHIPPEWYQSWIYRAGPTTVWQLGVVLYDMLHRNRFETTSYLNNRINISEELSQSCQAFLQLILSQDPQQRPSMDQLLLHPWLS